MHQATEIPQWLKTSPLMNRSSLKGKVAFLEPGRVVLGSLRFDSSGITLRDFLDSSLDEGSTREDWEPEALVERFAACINKMRSSKRGWIVVLPCALFSLDILTLPAVNRKNLETLIERKVAGSALSGGEDQAWCYEVLEEKKNLEEHTLRVLIARAPVTVIQRVHRSLKRHGIKARKVTISLPGILPLVAQLKLPEETGAVLAVEKSQDSLMLSIFKDGVLNQIRFLKGKTSYDEAKFSQFLNVELRRTLAYHKERFKGESIRHAVIFGDLPGFGDLGGDLPELEFTLFDYSTGSAGEELASSVGDHAGYPALMAGLLKSVCGKRGAEGIDFSQPQQRWGLKAAVAAAVIAGAALGAQSYTDLIQKNKREKAELLGRMTMEVQPFDRLMTEKTVLEKVAEKSCRINDLLATLEANKVGLAEPLLTAIELLPQDILLSRLDYLRQEKASDDKPAGHWVHLRLEGDFTGAGATGLLKLIDSLEGSGLYARVKYQSHGVKRSSHTDQKLREVVDLELTLP